MNKNSLRLGYFSAWGMIILTILYWGGFLLQFVIIPDVGWIPSKTSYYNIETSESFLAHFCGVVSFLQTPLILFLFAYLHDYAPGPLKIFSRVSLGMVISFAVLRTLSYIMELALSEINQHAGYDERMIYFIHSYFQTLVTGVYVVSVTVFLGLAELFIFPVFSKTIGVERNLRIAFLISGTIHLMSALIFLSGSSGILAYFLLSEQIVFAVITVLLVKFFKPPDHRNLLDNNILSVNSNKVNFPVIK